MLKTISFVAFVGVVLLGCGRGVDGNFTGTASYSPAGASGQSYSAVPAGTASVTGALSGGKDVITGTVTGTLSSYNGQSTIRITFISGKRDGDQLIGVQAQVQIDPAQQQQTQQSGQYPQYNTGMSMGGCTSALFTQTSGTYTGKTLTLQLQGSSATTYQIGGFNAPCTGSLIITLNET